VATRSQIYEAAAKVVLFYQLGRPELGDAVSQLAQALTDNAATAHTRSTDPRTSRDAAPTKLSFSQKRVLRSFKHRGPLTDLQLSEGLRGIMSASGVRSRRAELVRQGLVRDTGKTRHHNNRKHTVWGLVNDGKDV